jgi:hypothetical protein
LLKGKKKIVFCLQGGFLFNSFTVYSEILFLFQDLSLIKCLFSWPPSFPVKTPCLVFYFFE